MTTRLVAGRFVRITKVFGHKLPAPVWAVVDSVHYAASAALVSSFLGQEILLMTVGQIPTLFQITAPWDVFTVHTIDSLPQYALISWTKQVLLEGSD